MVALGALTMLGCGSDEADSPVATTAEVDSPAPTTAVGETATGVESVDADEVWTSAQPALDMCQVLASRDGSTVVAEMSDTAVAGDHTTGEAFAGPDQIAAWIDDAALFNDFEVTNCADEGVGGSWWSAATFAFSSDSNPGGAEGMVLVQPRDGKIVQLQLTYRLSEDDPTVADPVSEQDHTALSAWCESFGTLNAANVGELTTDDVALTPGRRPGTVTTGAEAIGRLIFLLENDPEDTMECSEKAIANGGLLASPFRWVITENEDPDLLGRGYGGIWVVRLDDTRLVDVASWFGQTMTADGILYDVSQDPDTGEVTVLNPEVLEDEQP
jgi:hypothetical protein